jgi:hypothetical protein
VCVGVGGAMPLDVPLGRFLVYQKDDEGGILAQPPFAAWDRVRYPALYHATVTEIFEAYQLAGGQLMLKFFKPALEEALHSRNAEFWLWYQHQFHGRVTKCLKNYRPYTRDPTYYLSPEVCVLM